MFNYIVVIVEPLCWKRTKGAVSSTNQWALIDPYSHVGPVLDVTELVIAQYNVFSGTPRRITVSIAWRHVEGRVGSVIIVQVKAIVFDQCTLTILALEQVLHLSLVGATIHSKPRGLLVYVIVMEVDVGGKLVSVGRISPTK